ncbi:hypothetical protein O179_04315 [Chlamydia trachomatis]|nr:hypothetical protein O169_04325 [Chlamydia trachomatis]AGT67696.1 hypothetical protein O173_04315 [Chlamydia trachomatis F/11-96]AGT65841.1 hypothetical protein O170_04310 [Chlamydia trachomatis]AGT66768.1 hypothetical protein O172_04305 [Chlamydia trachomatis]AGT68617.1 hypothetical protein O175_04320 [Chlamydia trachomatis]
MDNGVLDIRSLSIKVFYAQLSCASGLFVQIVLVFCSRSKTFILSAAFLFAFILVIVKNVEKLLVATFQTGFLYERRE